MMTVSCHTSVRAKKKLKGCVQKLDDWIDPIYLLNVSAEKSGECYYRWMAWRYLFLDICLMFNVMKWMFLSVFDSMLLLFVITVLNIFYLTSFLSVLLFIMREKNQVHISLHILIITIYLFSHCLWNVFDLGEFMWKFHICDVKPVWYIQF